MPESALGQPLTIHRPFHASPAQDRALFGAFGSGKSYAGCDEAIVWMLEQPGIRGLAARQTIPELKDTLEPVFMSRLPGALRDQCTIKRSGGHISDVVFPTGSTVMFRGLDDPQKHRSMNLGFLLIDEANEVDPETVAFMRGRLRQVDPTAEAVAAGYTDRITRRGSWLMSNPSGHDWMWEEFHPDSPRRRAGTEMFTSTSLDNPFLPPDYIETLLSFPEAWVRRFVLCSFEDFAGAVYPDWDPTPGHHLVPAYDVPLGEVVWMGMDPGTRNPTAGLWVHVDRARQRLVGITEYAEPYRAASAHAAAWRAMEASLRLTTKWRVSDPGSINVTDRGSNMTLHDQYRREGFNFALGPKLPRDRVPMLGLLIAQKRFLLMEGRCPRTAEAIAQYRWEEVSAAMKRKGQEAPEKPLKGEGSDLVDCAQYVASRMVPIPRLGLHLPPDLDDLSARVWANARKLKARQAQRLRLRGLDPYA